MAYSIVAFIYILKKFLLPKINKKKLLDVCRSAIEYNEINDGMCHIKCIIFYFLSLYVVWSLDMNQLENLLNKICYWLANV